LIKRRGRQLFPPHQFATREKEKSNWTKPRSTFEEDCQPNQNKNSVSLTGSSEGKFPKAKSVKHKRKRTRSRIWRRKKEIKGE